MRTHGLVGKVVDTVLLHGRGQCVLQLESTAQATAFLSYYAERPLVMNGKKLLCQRGAADITRTPVVMHRHILREVHHVSPRTGRSPMHRDDPLCTCQAFACTVWAWCKPSQSACCKSAAGDAAGDAAVAWSSMVYRLHKLRCLNMNIVLALGCRCWSESNAPLNVTGHRRYCPQACDGRSCRESPQST